jgi:hypothetical protein
MAQHSMAQHNNPQRGFVSTCINSTLAASQQAALAAMYSMRSCWRWFMGGQ